MSPANFLKHSTKVVQTLENSQNFQVMFGQIFTMKNLFLNLIRWIIKKHSTEQNQSSLLLEITAKVAAKVA